MNDAALTPSGDGSWVLGGVLDFSSVPKIWSGLEKLLNEGADLRLSLADVSQANSAGLVMLVEARDLARRNRCRLQLTDLPPGLLALARMSRCEELIEQNDT
ncbi:MAG: STAS domain-containing protein [Sedimenticolaceae bacterium]